MAKKPTQPAPRGRKPYKQARIRQPLADIAEAVAVELVQDFNQFVNDAVRIRLESMGRFPDPTRRPS